MVTSEDFQRIAPSVDGISLMTYDYSNPMSWVSRIDQRQALQSCCPFFQQTRPQQSFILGQAVCRGISSRSKFTRSTQDSCWSQFLWKWFCARRWWPNCWKSVGHSSHPSSLSEVLFFTDIWKFCLNTNQRWFGTTCSVSISSNISKYCYL
jgi:hypothetical protein